MATTHRRIRRNVRKYAPTRLRQTVSVEDALVPRNRRVAWIHCRLTEAKWRGFRTSRATIKQGPPWCCYNVAGSPFVHVRDSSTRRAGAGRSEERRVGKECRSRWWGYH